MPKNDSLKGEFFKPHLDEGSVAQRIGFPFYYSLYCLNYTVPFNHWPCTRRGLSAASLSTQHFFIGVNGFDALSLYLGGGAETLGP